MRSVCPDISRKVKIIVTYKIWLPILGVALLAVVATLPELTAVWPERKVVRETFTTYTDALIKRRFAEAYAYHSPEFKEKITLRQFRPLPARY